MSGTLSSQDQDFITSTSQDNLSEITDGRLAEQQSGSLATTLYGRQLVADHTFVVQQTYAAALQSGATVATAPDETQQAQTAQLQTLAGTDFDQQYLSSEIEGNAQSTADGQTEAASGQDPAVLQLGALLVPFQAQHLLQAQILQALETGGTPPDSTQPTGAPGLALAPDGPLNAQDQSFLQQQASDNAAEIQAGQLAETQGEQPAVSVYGRWLVLDHTVLNAALAPIADAAGVTLPDAPDDQQAATNATLQGLTGSAFDLQYLSDEQQSNVQGIGALVQEVYNGSDPALVALAQAALPLQEQHLAGAVQAGIALSLGANDQTGAPSTLAGQIAAAIGTYTAAAVTAAAQQLAAPSGSDLFPSVPGAGASSLAALTAAGSGASTAGALLTPANASVASIVPSLGA